MNEKPLFLSLVDPTAAPDKCMKANAPPGGAHRMHPDANATGDAFALVVICRLQGLDRSRLSPRSLDAHE